MSKTLSTTEEKRRKYRNIYKSLENKLLGKDIIWWNALTMSARYSLVFKWIEFKYSFKKRFKKDPKLKYFIISYKSKYKPSLDMYRNSMIHHIIEE